MKNCEYWIWLQRTLGYGFRIEDIINCFGSARELYEAGKNEWMLSGLFNSRQIGKLTEYSPSESAKIMKDCQQNHWDIITPDDPEYPSLLLETCNYPAVLYVDGNTECISGELFISIVGTRKASIYGTRAAGVISSMLSDAGFTVVSGGALGVDSAAHNGALNAGKPTVCILGCGLGTDYLKENEALRFEIARKGALITEFAPFTAASRTTFPMRNRIISGMSLGTVVVEAGQRSGSLITARCALEQGRDVFAVPGDVFASSFDGANRLIHDGAKPVFTAFDIVEEYCYSYPDRLRAEKTDIPLSQALREYTDSNENRINRSDAPPKRDVRTAENKPTAVLPENAGKTAKSVYNAIDGETDLDEIVTKSGLSIQKALSGITELEMYGVIEMLPGRKYKKI